ncbi:hypothetical protein C5C07_07550 [Haloferax sp. Atlit-4N]|uniref:DUF4365 domain-containing protein n=1 Tax=Haloferax sp. Atlit-4N TaxID=2077206 RepID=UPI000E246862|nr:DUF4365 domain-containing protein [Haloferax sp. Atlit-4N]RDZ55355.1 hypothetical protein C5C07_07550 [Haloferax sp. Atlit-4N]
MADEDDEKVKPAPYPDTDTAENDAVDLIEYILDDSVKSYIDSRDKAPNHDGYVEVVDKDNAPIGRIVVQVKKLPKKNQESVKKQLDTRHLSYCHYCIEPFFILLVDVNREIAYWKHITVDWFKENNLSSQSSKVVHFQQNQSIKKNENGYVEEWKRILNNLNEYIKNYEKYQSLKQRSNPAIGRNSPEFGEIHAFLDSYHDLLQTEFEIVKSKIYPDVWRVGFGSITYEENSLEYTLYPIDIDENDAQIRDIEKSWDEVHDLGAKAISGSQIDNPLSRSPSRYAYNALEYTVQDLIRNKNLDYSGCTFLAAEYIYDFVSEFHELLGLDEKESYSTEEVRDGYYRYLQYWLSEKMRGILQDHSVGEVHVGLEGYLNLDPDKSYEHAHNVAEKRFEEEETDPPRHRLTLSDHKQRLLEEFIDVLYESDIDKLERPFCGRDKDSLDSDVSNILAYYSNKSAIENTRRYYENYYKEYETIVENNFPQILDEISTKNTNHLLIIMSESGEDVLRMWSIRTYWLESDVDDWTVDCHWSTDPEVPEEPQSGHDITYNGVEYHAPVISMGGDEILRTIDSDYESLLDDVHDELIRKVRTYFHEQKVPVKHTDN